MARILVADDDEAVRTAIRRALATAGHMVEEATDGVEVLAKYRASRHDLVVIDLYMPGMDGLQAVIRLKAERPDVRIVALSGGGYRDKHDVLTMARERGATATVAKPFELSELVETVSKVLGGEQVGRTGVSSTTRARVLVVDDDDGTRRVLRKRLEAAGDEVIEAKDAITALERFRDQDVDVVVTDLILPGTSGAELIEAVLKAKPGVGVVAISGDPDLLSVVEKKFAGQPGVRAFPKPFTTPQLLEALDAVRGPR